MLVLAACATTEKYEARLNAEIGRPIDDVVLRWGRPTGVTDVDQTKRLYHFRSAGSPIATTQYNPYLGAQTTVSQFYCDTTFLVEGGVVQKWSWQGNRCTSD